MKNAAPNSPDARLRREQAEQKLREGRPRATPLNEDNTSALVHELQVHQIELEMQNEELHRAQLEAQRAADKYLELFDFAPVGYFVLDPLGMVREVNLAGAALLGLDRQRVTHQPFEPHVAPDFRAAFSKFWQSVQPGEGQRSCEVRLLKHGDGPRDMLVEATVVELRPGEPQGYRLAVTDITERRRAEDEIRQLNAGLEQRVAARTAELQAANAALRASRLAALNLSEDAVEARKRAEQATAELRASEERYRSLVDLCPDAIIVVQDGRLVFVNAAALRLHGADAPDQIIGQPVLNIVHPDDRELVRERIDRVLKGETAHLSEVRGVGKNGKAILVESVGAPVDYDGRPAVQVILRDITVRKRIGDTHDFLSHCGYQASGENFFQALARYLAQSLGMDFVCIDRLAGDGLAAQTVAVFFDGKFEDNVAYALKDTPCGDVVGEAICCFPKDVRHLFPKDAVLQEMKAESYVGTTLWGFDGKAIGLIAVIGRKPLADPRLAESVLKLVAVRAAGELQRQEAEDSLRRARDELELRVQERTARLDRTNQRLRHAVRVRREAERRVKEAELRYRTVADFTYDWEYWRTPEGLLLYCSPSCERITGYTPAELAASPELLPQMIHPQDRENWEQHECEAIAEPTHRSLVFRIQRKTGELRWIEHSCQPVIGSQGEFLGIRGSNHDITDRKAEEQQIQQLREELARVTRVTTAGQLAASLAHELNQPLTAILSNAQTAQMLLAADPPDVAEVREALGDIEHDSERAGRVIRRLRALFKKTGQERSRLQLNDLIEETLDLLRSEFVLKGISTQVDLEPKLPEVLGNRIELQQVVLNLVVNGMEAMHECEPAQRRLEIATRCEGPAQIRVSVRDSGPGIRVEPISRLFEPFFTTKPNGMGMGLAISHSIMEAHDGSLGAANNPDRGATFHITLPIHPGGQA